MNAKSTIWDYFGFKLDNMSMQSGEGLQPLNEDEILFLFFYALLATCC